MLKRTFMITYDTLGCCNLRFLFLVKEKGGEQKELRLAFPQIPHTISVSFG